MESLRALIQSPTALLAFEAAARHGSFTRAAAELNVTQAAVSASVRQLEKALEVSLFRRHHRSIELTEAGERFFEDVSIGLGRIRRSAEAIRRQRAGPVTISVSTAFAGYWMLPRLATLRASMPEIDLRLQTTDKDVDLAAEGLSLGVRRGTGDWPEYDSARLAAEEIVAVCRPSLLDGRARPNGPADLLSLPLIHLDEPFRPCPDWRDWFAAQGIPFHDRGDGLRLNDYALVIQATVEGQGVALGWRYMTDRLVDTGLLTRVVRNALVTPYGFYVVWAADRPLSADAERVRDWMLAA